MRSPAACLCALLVFAGHGKCENAPPEFSEAEQAQLQRDKILVGTKEYRQSFQPYIDNPLPSFVTSDAVLNAFHVVFEESFVRLEAANVPRLEALVEQITQNLQKAVTELKGADPLKAGAARRAEIVMKTALRLLGRPAPGSSKAIEQIIAAQVQEVEAAVGQRMPDWLGPPDETFAVVDFTRYAPRGFYNRSQRMQRYFRATAWLQSIPFRAAKDEELTAAMIIGRAAGRAQPKPGVFPREEFPLLEVWETLLPGGDTPDVRNMMAAAHNWPDFDFSEENNSLRARMQTLFPDEQSKDPFLNDQLRTAPEAPPDRQCRVLAASVLPDAILFQSTSHLSRIGKQRYPDTLELAAGLGSVWATGHLNLNLPAEVWSEVHPAIKQFAGRTDKETLYDEYLGCLRELVNEPDPAAPGFIKGEPWKRKSSQTVLSSWAQMRHTLLLQAKSLIIFLGSIGPPAGFVEPDPEFFRRLGELSARCLAFFTDAGIAGENDETLVLDQVQAGRDAADLLHKSGGAVPWDDAISRSRSLLGSAAALPESPAYPERIKDEPEAAREKRFEDYRKELSVWAGRYRDALDQYLKKFAAASPARRRELIAKLNHETPESLTSRWLGLIRICLQAQDIAHCELRGLKLTGQQDAFVSGFGVLLARAMFHDGNSYISPRDDAPRIADVLSGPEGHLEAGIGRPRAFYVLYPSEGKEMLCQGAVLPYYEFKHGPERLTDAAWMERLKKDPPAPPAWVKPILAPSSGTGGK